MFLASAWHRAIGTLTGALGSLALLACARTPASGIKAVEVSPAPNTETPRVDCPIRVDRLAPLVVDWNQDEQAALDRALHAAGVVVAYDCKTLRVLDGCHVPGHYSYRGITKRASLVQLLNADEVRASLPTRGIDSSRALGVDFERGGSVDIASVVVGQWQTTRVSALLGELEGNCSGATHFVRSVDVGAFVVTKGEGKKADPGPPPERQGPVRLELIAISPDRAHADSALSLAASSGPGCPEGLAWNEGKCSDKASLARHACRPMDHADCREQCRRGEATSCTAMGAALDNERLPSDEENGGAVQDFPAAAEFYRKGCEAGDTAGCVRLGFLALGGRGVPRDSARGVELMKRACEAGDAFACHALAEVYAQGSLVPQDLVAAAELYRQACERGAAVGCRKLGEMYELGRGVTRDPERARTLYARACDEGDALSCTALGMLYESGRGVAKDRERAIEAFTRGCDAGAGLACRRLVDISGQYDP